MPALPSPGVRMTVVTREPAYDWLNDYMEPTEASPNAPDSAVPEGQQASPTLIDFRPADPDRAERERLNREHWERGPFVCDDQFCLVHPAPPSPEADHSAAEVRRDKLGARTLDAISADPPAPLLLDRLDPAGHTILFGPGGAGKGTLASYWITQLTSIGRRVLILDYENHPEEWARRLFGLGGTRDTVLHTAPTSAAWHAARGAIWEHQEEVRGLATDFDADILVIDSIIPACGPSDALKTESPSLYAAALGYIGLPVLSLAHVTKTQNMEHPFGSVFWHNLARVTWSLEPKEEGAWALLACRKANNYQRPPRQRVETIWRDGRPASVYEKHYAESIANRIAEILTPVEAGETISISAKEITEQLNAGLDPKDYTPSNSISQALNRNAKGPTPRFVPLDGKKWGLAS